MFTHVEPLQSVWDEFVHVTWQLLETQVDVAPETDVVHCLLQLPQFPLSLVRSTQALLQMESPLVSHDCPHAVPLHVASPPLGAPHFVHAVPHAFASLATQLVPHK